MKAGLKLFLILVTACVSGVSAQIFSTDNSGEKFQISLVMPFCSKQLMENPEHKNAAIGNACRQYYEGFILALDSFKKSEIPVEIKVYDNRRDSNAFKKIIENKEVQNSDLIIGPVLKEGNEMMLEYCKKNKIYHVSPFLTLTKSKIDDPYLISAYPDYSYYGDFILEQIKNNHDESPNVLVITGKDANDQVLSSRIMALKGKYPSFNFKNVELSKIADYKTFYKPGKPNYVILSCENEIQTGSTLKFLSDTNSFNDLQVFGLRKWLEFKAPNINLLEQLNVKIITPFYMNYADSSNKRFIEKYRERYFTDPDEYAIAGYEQATFFISSLIMNHGSIEKIKDQKKNKPLSNWYQFREKTNSKSLQNNLLNVLYFEDGKLMRYYY